MDSEIYDLERSFWRSVGNVPRPDPAFEDLWPTESRGSGHVVKNNLRTGAAQGKGSFLRKAHCRLCGFPNDLGAIDHSGGSIDGEGAGGAITSILVSAPVTPQRGTGGTTHTEWVGTQAYRNGSGCALCFSKDSSKQRVMIDAEPSPWDRLRSFGF